MSIGHAPELQDWTLLRRTCRQHQISIRTATCMFCQDTILTYCFTQERRGSGNNVISDSVDFSAVRKASGPAVLAKSAFQFDWLILFHYLNCFRFRRHCKALTRYSAYLAQEGYMQFGSPNPQLVVSMGMQHFMLHTLRYYVLLVKPRHAEKVSCIEAVAVSICLWCFAGGKNFR